MGEPSNSGQSPFRQIAEMPFYINALLASGQVFDLVA
jgi:hypothetical protein